VSYEAGDYVLLIDHKDRELFVQLEPGRKFSTHLGLLDLDSLIGADEACTVLTKEGRAFLCVPVSLEDVAVHMPRAAQIVYPKDVGFLLAGLAIAPGMNILESGVGSGAVTMSLARAGARVVSVELREDFASRAAKNFASFLTEQERDRIEVVVQDLAAYQCQGLFDGAVLDLLDPWTHAARVAQWLRPGARVAIYVTNTVQLSQTVSALRSAGFVRDRAQEVLVRDWVVRGEVVRPAHRMVGHTGFVVTAIRRGGRVGNLPGQHDYSSET